MRSSSMARKDRSDWESRCTPKPSPSGPGAPLAHARTKGGVSPVGTHVVRPTAGIEPYGQRLGTSASEGDWAPEIAPLLPEVPPEPTLEHGGRRHVIRYLKQALADLTCKKATVRGEAQYWALDDVEQRIFSLGHCCDHLGIDAAATRRLLREALEARGWPVLLPPVYRIACAHRVETGNAELLSRMCPCGKPKRNSRIRGCTECLTQMLEAPPLPRASDLFKPLFEQLRRLNAY